MTTHDDAHPSAPSDPATGLTAELAARGYHAVAGGLRARAAGDLRALHRAAQTLAAAAAPGTDPRAALDRPADLLDAAQRLARELPDLLAALAGLRALTEVSFLVPAQAPAPAPDSAAGPGWRS
ncbi:hypothetical protein ACSNOI_44395, partial [Actinomadura kijaniata]|uniref:hypothetical protein n=1 Tax=Actinomadura kijaniata TaxID=46161 RepID=UPI003F1CFDEC